MNVYHCWYYHKEHFFALIENDCIGIAYFWFQDAHDMFYFYISFVSVMDSFISLGHIVIVIMQRCHFYFFEMNSPTTLYCFLSCCGTILSSFSCFSIVFHRRPSILTTTPSIPPVARHETANAYLSLLSRVSTSRHLQYCHHYLSIASVAYTNIHIIILDSSVSVKDTDCKILHPF